MNTDQKTKTVASKKGLTLGLIVASIAVIALIAIMVTSMTTATPDAAPAPTSKDPSAAMADTANTAKGSFSHADWETVLEKFVDEKGLVDYEALAEDRAVFDRYVQATESVSPKSKPGLFPTKNDQLAYYINAYNAQVFKGVLSRGPEDKTVWTPFGTGASFFSNMDITIGGKKTSLKELEDDVIRAEYKDPRIHAALNCASLGCPRLPREAFVPERLNEQLDREMRQFIAEARNTKVDSGSKSVKLSKIFDWFSGDFLAYEKAQGNANPSILDYVNRFRDEGKKIPGSYKVSYFDYDKAINAQ